MSDRVWNPMSQQYEGLPTCPVCGRPGELILEEGSSIMGGATRRLYLHRSTETVVMVDQVSPTDADCYEVATDSTCEWRP